jgi:predicted  nucleic acid-binding Zn-ribbon protein
MNAPVKLAVRPSPARAKLHAALADRERANAVLTATAAATTAAHKLTEEPAKLRAELVEIEARAARVVSEWATGGAVGAPELTDGGTLEDLRRELADADRLASAATSALPELRQRVEAAQRVVQSANAAIRAAATAVMVEEAVILEAELATAERTAVALRTRLLSLGYHLDLDAHRGNPNANDAVKKLRSRMSDAPPSPRDQDIRAGLSTWGAFAERLIADPAVELERS